jgi:hypothetical protein
MSLNLESPISAHEKGGTPTNMINKMTPAAKRSTA